MRKPLGTLLGISGLGLSVLCAVPAAFASNPLTFAGSSGSVGNGLGAVVTVLTVQKSPSEQGCVSWNGSADVIGSGACPSGISGGDEKTGASQTLTRKISEVNTTDAANLRVVFNGNESDSSITLDDLRLTIYKDTDGSIVYQSAAFPAPVPFNGTFGGVGGAGQLYKIDPTDAAALNTANVFSNGNYRIGLAGKAEGSTGGAETFSLSRACPTITIAPSSLPAAVQGQAYLVDGTVTGGVTPYSSITASPAGPYFGGIVFSSDTSAGTFSFAGTPTSSGSVSVTVAATDANGCPGQIVYSLVVNSSSCPTITVSPTSLADATAGQAYGPVQFSASGGTGPYTFDDGGSLAGTGLTLSSGGSLSGTPTITGTISFSVTATDTGGSPAGCQGGASLSLVINLPPAAGLVSVPTIGYPAMALLALALAGVALHVLRRP